MNDFTSMEKLVHLFILEAKNLLNELDNNLMKLKKTPEDKNIINVIYSGFHILKGGTGLLLNDQSELLTLCCLIEDILSKLHHDEMQLNPDLLHVILSATGEVRQMLNDLGRGMQPQRPLSHVLDALEAAL